MVNKIECCRVCKNSNLIPVLDLGEQYLTGTFPKTKDLSLTKGPLRLVMCHGKDDCCGLLQLEHSYDTGEMYGENYGYRSGINPTMVSHLHSKVKKILSIVDLRKSDLVVDIGSNDGTTLGFYPDNLELVGVDPTAGKFKKYYKPHVNFHADFFSSDYIENEYSKKAKVITSFSMLYDLEDPMSFVGQIAQILDNDGIWVFEQSYLPLMLKQNSFDTVCHEHIEYYGLHQIKWILEKSGLKILDVELNDVNGGSFSVVACLVECNNYVCSKSVNDYLEDEAKSGLMGLEPYEEFARNAERVRLDMRNFVDKSKSEGKKIYALGASTKGNVFLQYCNITGDEVEAIGEVNSEKFGCFTPGSWIKIMDEDQILASNPDYLIILPWHFRDFFLNTPKFKGHTLVFQLPELEILKIL